MKARKTLAVTAALMLGAAGLTACGGSNDTNSTPKSSTGATGGQKVSMKFWHNSTTGEGKDYWDATVKAFEAANPNVKITVQSIQNEQMDGKLQTALNSGDAPDIFMARGGGKLADIVKAGQVQDLSAAIDPATKTAVGEGMLQAFAVDGKIYGMPVSVLPGGMYYAKDLFDKAGVTTPPTTMAELETAVGALRASGTEPIALGAKAGWPAGHWFYFFALRECSKDAMDASAKARNFEDPCFTKAGDDLKNFAAKNPFNKGFLTTTPQEGAGSSAGLIANHKASMELMGAWDPGVIGSLTPDKKPLKDLGWFPFPAVDGGQGDPAAMMGGVDGYSCSVKAPPECAKFLNFIIGKQYQEGYANAFHTLPASQEAQSVVTEPALKSLLEAYNKAPYVMVWLDTLFGQNIGNALNTAVVDMLAGKGDGASIVKAVNAAAAQG